LRRLAPILSLTLVSLYLGCAAHPTIADHTLKKGEKYYGYTLSTENIFPVMFYRFGLSDVSDLGLRVGVPIYGSGIDYSRTLFEKGKKRDVLNVGWSLSPNSSYDFTYFKFRDGKKEGDTIYWAFRSMIIPDGSYAESGQSTRIGFLLGLYRKSRFGIEAGYFHDFASMPITKLFSSFDYSDTTTWGTRFLDYPHVSDGGLPTEYSRLTGLSLRVSFNLSAKKEENGKLPKP